MVIIEFDTGDIAMLFEIDTGPDKIPPPLLKELSYEAAPCISLMFRASL